MELRQHGECPNLECRAESHEKVDKQRRYNQILGILKDKELTALEVASEMYQRGYTKDPDRNNAHPRLTELMYKGKVEIIGKKKCEYTGRNVSVYRRIDDGRNT